MNQGFCLWLIYVLVFILDEVQVQTALKVVELNEITVHGEGNTSKSVFSSALSATTESPGSIYFVDTTLLYFRAL